MSKKLQVLFGLFIVFSMILSACAPAAEPEVTEPPVVTEAPVAVDYPALLADLWASIPPDAGFGAVAAAKLNEELVDKAPFILDIREPAELQEESYIEGAVNIPFRSVLQNLDKLPGLDEPIVVYCRTGHRGGLAMTALRLLGYTNVRNLAGGINAWKSANLPAISGSLPAEAAVLGTPIIENEALYTALNDFITNMPESLFAIKADALAAELADTAPFVLDVRTQDEWDKEGYIEGAVLVPFPNLLNSLDQLPAEKDARIVVYCRTGHRGSVATMALQLLGYTNVVNLAGGLNGWKAASMPVAGWVDWPVVWGEFITALPADQGFYTVKADVLNGMLVENPPFIVDVREASEVAENGYITGAINIPVRELLKNLDKLPAQDQKIVVYCASGHRAALATAALRLLGYTDVVNLAGGMNGWLKAEFAVETGTPAAPVAGTAPEVDAVRLATLDAYLSGLPADFGAIKPVDLNTEIAGGTVPFMLDLRSEEEKTADGYIEGSTLVFINDLPANLTSLPTDKAAPIVTVCKSGHRGAIVMMYLQALGYTNVRNMAGGMNAWTAAELPVVK